MALACRHLSAQGVAGAGVQVCRCLQVDLLADISQEEGKGVARHMCSHSLARAREAQPQRAEWGGATCAIPRLNTKKVAVQNL